MANQLETLFKLQGLDTLLLEKQKTIEKYEAELAERRQAIAACDARIEALAATRKELVAQRALAERRLSDAMELLKQRRQRLQKVRNERELRAGQEEITSGQTELSEVETLALELMAKVEEMESVIEVARKERADLESADHRHVSDAAERVQTLRRELESDRGTRDGMAEQVEAGLRKKYELILSRRSGLAVVEVDGAGCCVGCHVQIPPQTLIEVRKTGAVRVCPMCQRLLFIGGIEVDAVSL
ncbi:MAG: hypothetical protein HY899_09885 [Deltaproteobacteria bacterium]|nr:hypothetical protein [Deltaproteobacteria bacterium]